MAVASVTRHHQCHRVQRNLRHTAHLTRPLRVLVVCEYSGLVRDAFSARGHYARSCDLLPTESITEPVRYREDFSCVDCSRYDPNCDACTSDEPWCHYHSMFAFECPCMGPTEDEADYINDGEYGARHLTGDLFAVEDIEGYDLVIAHPPCTHLAVSGARWLTRHWVKKKRHPKGGYWHDPTEKLRLQKEALAFVKRIWALPVKHLAIENPVSRLSTLFMKPTQLIEPWQHGHGETKRTCLWLRGLPRIQPTCEVPGREARIWSMPPSPDRGKLRSKSYAGVAAAFADQWSDFLSKREP